MNEDSITTIYCSVDDFCKVFEAYCKSRLFLPGEEEEAIDIKWFPDSCMSLSEVMTIILLFQLSNYRTFKAFYLEYVCTHMQNYFPNTVSYNRFVELKPYTLLPLLLYTHIFNVSSTEPSKTQ